MDDCSAISSKSDEEENFVLKFDRTNDLKTEITPLNQQDSVAQFNKNMFALNIGSNNDFLKRSQYHYTNYVYSPDEYIQTSTANSSTANDKYVLNEYDITSLKSIPTNSNDVKY